MRRLLAAALALLGSAASATAGPIPPTVDYADPSRWICRPGVDDGTCSAGLEAVHADGRRVPYSPANKPAVDCFYVYPTSSNDPALLSDLDATDERKSVHDQTARFGSVCRLFVPIYHQVTIEALKRSMAVSGDPARMAVDIDLPYRDVLAAWRHYLAHDNRGRGIILIGHSQGALILTRLIAREIEGKPVAGRLIAGYLAGALTMDSASFRRTPPCRSNQQTGCFVGWSIYAADYAGPRMFGRADPGATPICVNPARLDGGAGLVKAYLHNPDHAAGAPPWMLITDRITARCVADEQGAALRVSIERPNAATLLQALPKSRAGPSWDWHPHDIDLVQGNLIDLAQTQSAAWLRRGR